MPASTWQVGWKQFSLCEVKWCWCWCGVVRWTLWWRRSRRSRWWNETWRCGSRSVYTCGHLQTFADRSNLYVSGLTSVISDNKSGFNSVISDMWSGLCSGILRILRGLFTGRNESFDNLNKGMRWLRWYSEIGLREWKPAESYCHDLLQMLSRGFSSYHILISGIYSSWPERLDVKHNLCLPFW